jgi:hypothetical protein
MENDEKFCACKKYVGLYLVLRMCQITEDLKYGSQFYDTSEE